MFSSPPLPYKLVQVRSNRFNNSESFLNEFIYKFHRHTERCCIKYIVSLKEYNEGLLTVDYYPKLNFTPRKLSLSSIQDLRYRHLTRQNSLGLIGGTILDIMVEVQDLTRKSTWGCLGASLPTEETNENTKRFRAYKNILSRSFQKKQKVFGETKHSAIFVIPVERLHEKELIVEMYEQIFSETN